MAALAMIVALLPFGVATADEHREERNTDNVCPPPDGWDDGDGDFSDIDPEGGHYDNIRCLGEYEIALGGPEGRPSDEYGPGLDVQRHQMASFIADFIRTSGPIDDDDDRDETRQGEELPPPDEDQFDDIDDVIERHRNNINALADAGVALGVDGDNYDPRSDIQRQQMASLIADAIDFAHNGEVDDSAWEGVDYEDDRWEFDDTGEEDIPNVPRHRESIRKLAATGIVVGFAGEGDSYGPKESTNRAQMASFIMRGADYLDELGADEGRHHWYPTNHPWHLDLHPETAENELPVDFEGDDPAPRHTVTADVWDYNERAVGENWNIVFEVWRDTDGEGYFLVERDTEQTDEDGQAVYEYWYQDTEPEAVDFIVACWDYWDDIDDEPTCTDADVGDSTEDGYGDDFDNPEPPVGEDGIDRHAWDYAWKWWVSDFDNGEPDPNGDNGNGNGNDIL
jgi:hypothetical protein